jgi:hypothetical protein
VLASGRAPKAQAALNAPAAPAPISLSQSSSSNVEILPEKDATTISRELSRLNGRLNQIDLNIGVIMKASGIANPGTIMIDLNSIRGPTKAYKKLLAGINIKGVLFCFFNNHFY